MNDRLTMDKDVKELIKDSADTVSVGPGPSDRIFAKELYGN